MKNESLKDLISYGSIEDLKSVQKLEWRIENSTNSHVVAYQLNPDSLSQNKLEERLQKNTPGLLILSHEPSFKIQSKYWVVKENHWAGLINKVCDIFYPLPEKLKILAVTGTNGKTTTVDLVLQIAEMEGLSGFSIGTLGVRKMGKTIEEFGLTTPGQIQLREILYRHGRGCDFVAMEVSSHALSQDRVNGLQFTAAAWTNISQDHLDYHKTMEEYFNAKKKILQYLKKDSSLFIPATQVGLYDSLKENMNVKLSQHIDQAAKENLPIFFKSNFNLENLSCALSLLRCLEINITRIDFTKLSPPPGRFYIKEWNRRVAIVDFAHTPDALENILKAIRESFPGHRLIVLFGCGGDRDRSKRSIMGEIAEKYADKLVITSDNPRTENPEKIIQDILNGVHDESKALIRVERPEAVRESLAQLQAMEVLLIAGKGHEDYIIKGVVKLPYSDIDELDSFVRDFKG